MLGTVVKCPLLHSLGHAVGDFPVKRFLVVDGVHKCVISLFGQVFKHFLSVEYIFAEILGWLLLGHVHFHCLVSESLLNDCKP